MKSLLEFFIKNKIWSNALILLTFVFGLSSLVFGIKKSFFPEFSERFINVQVVYPGASPEEVEEGIVLKIEEELQEVDNIKEVTSVSQENIGTVNVEIKEDTDIDEILADVKNAVDRIAAFPADAEKPVVFKIKSTDRAAGLIVQGDVPLEALKKYAEDVEDDFLATGIISQVNISGIPSLEISVEIPEATLIQHRLTFDQVAQAIQLNNQDISAGSIKSTEEEVLIRSNNKVYEPERIENIPIRSGVDGSQLRLGNIATVTQQFSDSPNKTIYNQQNAVGINISKLTEEDLIEITDYIKDYIPKFNAENPGVSLIMTSDQSDLLWDRITLLVKNGGVGLLLVLFALGLFLNVRLSAWVAFGIPFSFFGLFIIGSFIGLTINMISLFGMIVVIGILVDDGIVIAENVYAHFERGKTPTRAAIDGTAEILPSVFASVLTTVTVFTAFFFIQGTTGEFMQAIGTVVVATLLFSLLEVVIILPSHLASESVLTPKKPSSMRARFIEPVIDFMRHKLYGPILKFSIKNKYIMVLVPVAFMMLVMGGMRGGLIKATFFPSIDGESVALNLVMTPGTREQITEDKLRQIASRIETLNDDFSEQLGGQNIIQNIRLDIGSAGNESGSHTGSINVELLGGEERGSLRSFTVSNAIREKVADITKDAEKFTVAGNTFFGKPISVRLLSENIDELLGAKQELKEKLAEFSDLKDITDNDVVGRREVRIELTDKAYALGLTHGDVSRQIRQGFFGQEVQRLQKGTDEVKVWIRYPESDRKNIGQLEQMKIRTATGQEYPITELVNYNIGRSIVAINHYNTDREIKVEADVADQDTPVPPIVAKIETDIIPELKAKYPSLSFDFGGQSQSSSEFGASMQMIMPVILLFMVILVALVFGSFSQAILIFLLIPVAAFCAVLGHGIEDFLQGKAQVPISILSSYGIIALIGVIINDAVIFLNKFNLNLQQGFTIEKAMYDAGIARFRAILLTSVTTVAGLYPIILESSFQAQFLKPMAISIAYGVLFGTLFILIAFPSIVLVANDLRRFVSSAFKGYYPSPESVEPAVQQMKELV